MKRCTTTVRGCPIISLMTVHSSRLRSATRLCFEVNEGQRTREPRGGAHRLKLGEHAAAPSAPLGTSRLVPRSRCRQEICRRRTPSRRPRQASSDERPARCAARPSPAGQRARLPPPACARPRCGPLGTPPRTGVRGQGVDGRAGREAWRNGRADTRPRTRCAPDAPAPATTWSWPAEARVARRAAVLLDDAAPRRRSLRCRRRSVDSQWTGRFQRMRLKRPRSRDDRPMTGERRCSSCRAPADWLVAYRYNEDQLGGRLLVYCDADRQQSAGRLDVVLPLVVLDADPDRVLTLLYECGATSSDPPTAAEVIGVDAGTWVDAAQRALRRSERE